MGSGPSKAVKEAFKHFCNGLNVAEASKKAGCDQSTLRRFPAYRAMLKHIDPSRKSK